MIIKYHFKNLEAKDQRFIEQYTPKKIDGIEKHLSNYVEDAVVLTMHVSRFEKHNAFSTEFVLSLPSKTIVAKEASHDIGKSIDFAKNRLVRQIRKHDAHLRKEHTFDREHGTIRTKETVGSLDLMTKNMFA